MSPTSLVVNLAGSFQVAPGLLAQSQERRVLSDRDPDAAISSGYAGRAEEPCRSPAASPAIPQLLGGLSDIHRQNSDAVVSHYAIQPTFDVYATTQDADLGSVASAIQKVLDDTQRDLPPGATVDDPRPGRDHERGLFGPVLRPGRSHRADLPADRRQFPFLVRSLRDRHGLARRAGRHRLDAVRHPHHASACRR